jgi:hypothetical protein
MDPHRDHPEAGATAHNAHSLSNRLTYSRVQPATCSTPSPAGAAITDADSDVPLSTVVTHGLSTPRYGTFYGRGGPQRHAPRQDRRWTDE